MPLLWVFQSASAYIASILSLLTPLWSSSCPSSLPSLDDPQNMICSFVVLGVVGPPLMAQATDEFLQSIAKRNDLVPLHIKRNVKKHKDPNSVALQPCLLRAALISYGACTCQQIGQIRPFYQEKNQLTVHGVLDFRDMLASFLSHNPRTGVSGLNLVRLLTTTKCYCRWTLFNY